MKLKTLPNLDFQGMPINTREQQIVDAVNYELKGEAVKHFKMLHEARELRTCSWVKQFFNLISEDLKRPSKVTIHSNKKV